MLFHGIVVFIGVKLQIHLPVMCIDRASEYNCDLLLLPLNTNAIHHIILTHIAEPNQLDPALN